MKTKQTITGAGKSISARNKHTTLVIRLDIPQIGVTRGSVEWLCSLDWKATFREIAGPDYSGRIAEIDAGCHVWPVISYGIVAIDAGSDWRAEPGFHETSLEDIIREGNLFQEDPPLTEGAGDLLGQIFANIRRKFRAWVSEDSANLTAIRFDQRINK